MKKLEEVYATYGRPIWITEFAVRDHKADSPETDSFSEDDVLDFMKEILIS